MSQHANDAIHQLVQMGVRHFCICPGSRSTPFTVAIARHPDAHSHIFHDERSAAFCALGLGKSGQLAVLVVTSGTAVANAYPAVIEADAANIPLLLLTADRPPELRASNANQTIDQCKIFGERVRFFFDFPSASPARQTTYPIEEFIYPIEAQRNTISFAVSKATGLNPGPVHLNWMFREPFDISDSTAVNSDVSYPVFHTGAPTLTAEQKNDLINLLKQSHSGLLVIGELTSPSEQQMVQEIIEQIPWPMIIDAGSGLRIQEHPNMILAWEDVLRNPPFHSSPDLIVQLGNGLCSKRYEQWISNLTCPIVVMNSRPISSNPSSAAIVRYQCQISDFKDLSKHCSNSNLLPIFNRYNQSIKKSLLNEIKSHKVNDIQITNAILQHSPDDCQVFIGNSMPIRDINNYLFNCTRHVSASNRGASGIDGLTSTAYGWMLGHNRPTLLLIGDLSLMHDWGVLFTLSQTTLPQPLIIVVINNGGGGIFSMLPISQEHDVFESHFATAHTHHFTPILQAMGISAHTVSTMDHFHSLYADLWNNPAVHVIEFLTNRNDNTELRQTLQQLVQQGWSQ